ncbi:MAG TPA: chaperone modulator CbpM [Solirubrobacteraceae bacterium]|jgi:DNA-binding transcriptional MerR regulator
MSAPTTTRTFQLVSRRAPGRAALTLEQLARESALHPDMIRRFVALGLIAPGGGTAAAPLFAAQDAALLARAARLRRDLGLNYAGAVLACELLARIEHLERRLRDGSPAQRRHEVIRWTRTG